MELYAPNKQGGNIMVNQERIVESFLKYVQIDSTTREEGEFAKLIEAELKELGLEVYIDGAGEVVGADTGNIIAKLSGSKDVEPILFSCHMDTVTPGKGIKPVIKDGTIYSDGTTILGADNKAGIAAVIEALRLLKETNLEHGPIEIAFSIAEEGGLNGAKNLEYDKISAKKAFILDSGGDPGQIIVKGPAQDKVNVKVIGKPAHAGVCPEEGISAVMVAAEAINNMKLLRIDEETTANIGVVEGGKATNIVMPELTIKAEARSLSNEKLDKQTAHMVKCFKDAAEKFGTTVEIETARMYSAFTIADDDEIVKLVQSACEKAEIKPFLDATGGGSDTNVFNANGIKAVNLGIGERKPHTLEEHIHIKDLVAAAKLVYSIIETI